MIKAILVVELMFVVSTLTWHHLVRLRLQEHVIFNYSPIDSPSPPVMQASKRASEKVFD